MKITVADRTTWGWRAAAGVARDVYADAFAADTQPDPDRFVVAWANRNAPDGTVPRLTEPRVLACVGMTFASERPFFSEQYLDAAIEDLVDQFSGGDCDRNRIVEIGSLASQAPQAGRELVRVTPIIAWCMGMQLILCTATRALRVTLDRLAIDFLPLGPARRGCLEPQERARWGRYYDDAPAVGIIALDDLSRLFADCTGRYAFDALAMTLLSETSASAV
jgi:hypothetical protein